MERIESLNLANIQQNQSAGDRGRGVNQRAGGKVEPRSGWPGGC